MDNGIQPGSRHYVVISHTVPADGDFSLNDLPGSGGRIDVTKKTALKLERDGPVLSEGMGCTLTTSPKP